eukprot:gene9111-10084_t
MAPTAEKAELNSEEMNTKSALEDGKENSENISAINMFVKSIQHQYSTSSNLCSVFKKLDNKISFYESSKSDDIDRIKHISLMSNNMKGYLQCFEYEHLPAVLDDINLESQKFISSLFGLENGFTYFHDVQFKGVVNVCKLALYMKYAKLTSDGFTALYTRPPVIYISGAAPTDFGKNLRTQLGLPQSSICKVSCNTLIGSPYAMDVAAFDRLLTDDVSCGKTPLILIAYAGTPVTGHTDNLTRLREICTQSGVWLHVEGDSLATLALPKVPPSIASSSSADSMTLNLPDWMACFTLPYCAEHSGLESKEIVDKLMCLPLWSVINSIGLEEMRNIFINASELAQQLSHRLDMVSGIKRLEQSNVVSPIVVFRYKATPSLTYSSSSSLEYEDDDVSADKISKEHQAMTSKNPVEISPKLSDAFNCLLANSLQELHKNVRIDVKQISREGICITFNPLHSAKACATTRDHIDAFIAQLEQEIVKMDTTLLTRNIFQEHFQSVKDVVLIDIPDLPIVGAFQCVPNYWKMKDLSNLSDIKKKEANDLNLSILDRLSEEFSNLHQGKSSSGQVFIQIGLVDDSFDISLFAERVSRIAEELEDNSKFLETVSDAIQAKIHEAEAGLQKESEEKFFEDGVLRNVPVFGSVYNWLSPPEKESRGVTGRAFNLASGKLESTEKTYKYKMQIQNESKDGGDPDNEAGIPFDVSADAHDDDKLSSTDLKILGQSETSTPESEEQGNIEEGMKMEDNFVVGDNSSAIKVDEEGHEVKESNV